jgi:cobalamin-dependent methionine synthase I
MDSAEPTRCERVEQFQLLDVERMGLSMDESEQLYVAAKGSDKYFRRRSTEYDR